jgi:PAS domain S-box-containing protein
LTIWGAVRERAAARQLAELRATTAALAAERDAARLFESVVVNARSGVAVLDAGPDGPAVRYANDAFCQMTGHPRGDLIGRPLPLPPVREMAAAGAPAQGEVRLARPDGSGYWADVSLVPVGAAGARPDYWVLLQRDVTERRRADDAHQDTARLLRSIIDAFPGLISAKDGASRYLLMNRHQADLYGTTPAGAVGLTASDLISPDYGAYTAARDRQVVETGETLQYEETTPDAAGRPHHWLTLKAPIREPDGAVRGLVNVSLDVSALKDAQSALRESEEQLRAIGDNLPDGAVYQVVAPPDGPPRFAHVSAGIVNLLGVTAAEVQADPETLHRLIHPDDLAGFRAAEAASFLALQPFECEFRSFTTGGAVRWLHTRSRPTPQPDGGSVWNGAVTDVTARRGAEEAVRRSEARYRLLFDRNPHPMWVFDQHTRQFLAVNDAAVRTYGYSRDEFLGMTVDDLHPPDDPRRPAPALAEEGGFDPPAPWRHRHRDGAVIEAEVESFALEFDGRPAELVLAQDVTERRQAEEALRRSEGLFRGIFQSAAAGVSLTDPTGRFVAANPAFLALVGRTLDELLTLTPVGLTHPDDWVVQAPLMRELTAGARDQLDMAKRYVRPDGGVVWTELSLSAVRGADGAYEYGLGVSIDVTARRRLEEQYRQSQQVEAVGHLAGGVAHDFNNLLTVITGNLALARPPEGDPGRPLLAAAEQAAARAADLTRKLLGYARRNQVAAGPVDPTEVLAAVAAAVGRGTDPRVSVRVEVAPGCGPVLADAGLLHQALLNLGMNARDAMPGGGTLTFSAGPVELPRPRGPDDPPDAPAAEPFIRFGVTDTGVGMSDDLKARIFEPFFTTKEVGKGTGLGLPMVRGVVEQHRGRVEVVTAPGAGSRFDVYLPSAPAAPARPSPAGITFPDTRAGDPAEAPARPTVLLVDDEAMIRELGRTVLERAGYRVLTADDGVTGVEMFTAHRGEIGLVVLDVTMPRMSGRDAFRHILELDPAARVLFSTGYSADDIASVDGSVGLLNKPYRPTELLAAVSAALAGPPT